ncbi:MAG: hypothetical protein HYX92_17920 [Chloroflexi bacterium]|nr:hypothetical protein [Chloroflexota bacterium]
MHPEIASQIDAIKQDRTHGAGWLSRRAIAALAFAAAGSQAKSVPFLLHELRSVAGELASARPSMTPIRNGVCQLVKLVEEEAVRRPPRGPIQLRLWTQRAAKTLVVKSRSATRRAARRAADLISDGDVVITCSYSAAVLKSFEAAKKQGRLFSVIAARSEGKDGRSYGEAMARKLASAGIPAEVVPDDALESAAARASLALVGADTVMPDGAIINGAPTLRLAQAAKRRAVPFYVVCETSKFLAGRDAPMLEEGFEVVPGELVDGIITERGPRAAALNL